MILKIHETSSAWRDAALESTLAAISAAAQQKSVLHLCLSGGTTPKPLYKELAEDATFRALATTHQIHLWVGDEREAEVGVGLRNSEMIAEAFAPLVATDSPSLQLAREIGQHGMADSLAKAPTNEGGGGLGTPCMAARPSSLLYPKTMRINWPNILVGSFYQTPLRSFPCIGLPYGNSILSGLLLTNPFRGSLALA